MALFAEVGGKEFSPGPTTVTGEAGTILHPRSLVDVGSCGIRIDWLSRFMESRLILRVDFERPTGPPTLLHTTRDRFMRRTAILLLTMPLVGGCFTYTPVDLQSVVSDMSVRVHVTEEGAARLPTGSDRDAPIEGTVIQADRTRVSVLPELGSAITDPVSFSVGDIESVERRELSQQRTWLTLGAGVAVGIGILLRIQGEPGSGNGTGNPPDFTRIPLGQFTFP